MDATILRFRAGDPDAVRLIYRKYGGEVHAVAQSIVDDPELAADVVQQTFVRAWRGAYGFDANRDLVPWLCSIARRTAIDAVRSETRSGGGGHQLVIAADGQLDASDQILQSPDGRTSPAAAVEEAVVAAVFNEAQQFPRTPAAPGREDRRYLWVIAATAALFLITGVSIGLLATAGDHSEGVVLGGTELAPGASATARLDETREGLQVVMSVTGLPPAEPGTHYEGWIRNDARGVSMGTFDLRGGATEVELWTGLVPPDYSWLIVTLQEESEGSQSSGQVVLRGSTGQ